MEFLHCALRTENYKEINIQEIPQTDDHSAAPEKSEHIPLELPLYAPSDWHVVSSQ